MATQLDLQSLSAQEHPVSQLLGIMETYCRQRALFPFRSIFREKSPLMSLALPGCSLGLSLGSYIELGKAGGNNYSWPHGHEPQDPSRLDLGLHFSNTPPFPGAECAHRLPPL